MRLVTIHQPDSGLKERLRQALIRYNINESAIAESEELGVFLTDSKEGFSPQQFGGGVIGCLWGSCLEIDYLWVAPEYRSRGFGRKLLHDIEHAAYDRGARTVIVNTFSFQAPDFYARCGYVTVLVVDGFPNGCKKYYLKKQLT